MQSNDFLYTASRSAIQRTNIYTQTYKHNQRDGETHIPDAQRTLTNFSSANKDIYTRTLYSCAYDLYSNFAAKQQKRNCERAGTKSERTRKRDQSKLFFVRAGDTTETLNLREYRIHAIWCFVGGGVTHAPKNQTHITLPLYLTPIRRLARFCLDRTECFEWIECTFSSGNSKIHFVHILYTHRVCHSVIKQLARETRRKWAKMYATFWRTQMLLREI